MIEYNKISINFGLQLIYTYSTCIHLMIKNRLIYNEIFVFLVTNNNLHCKIS